MSERNSRLKKILLSGVLVAYVALGIIVYSPSSPLRDNIAQLLKRPLAYFGLYYRFWPFEDPRKYKETFHALISFADGSREIWNFPQASKEEIRHSKDPVRAAWLQHMWDCYYYRFGQVQSLWPEAARYIATHANHPGQPLSVVLYANTTPISCDGRISDRQFGQTKLFEYLVKSEDIE